MLFAGRISKIVTAAVLAACWATALCGCKFDRSKIKMPDFNFITGENLHSISAPGSGRLWISGNYGTILFSDDNGQSWTKQQSGIDSELLGCIAFANRDEGWAAGVKGTVVHTSDGGRSWERQNSGTENDLLDLFFLDNRQGWAVGEYGIILHTDDGGSTWRVQGEEQDTLFNDIFFVDNRTGWVVGEFGTILHTADGGATWQPRACPDLEPKSEEAGWDLPMPALYGIFFADRRRGWIVGMDGVIIRTTDGGESWRKVDSKTDKPLYAVTVRGSRGWAVGNKGVLLMSGDGGQTWAEEGRALKTKFWLRDVAFVDERTGLIVGARGTIARSDDGGRTWDILSGFSYEMEEFGLTDF